MDRMNQDKNNLLSELDKNKTTAVRRRIVNPDRQAAKELRAAKTLEIIGGNSKA